MSIADLNPPRNSRGIFYLVLAGAVLCPAFLFAQAKLEFTEAKQSFGHVPKGEVVNLVYEIKNMGDQPLIVETYEVTCDCTKIRFPKEPILPGKTATVQVIFETKSAYGRQDRIVYLFSNDPKSPAKFRFKGTVDDKNKS